MDLHLQGKIAVITGGAGGIGTQVALGFAQEGCKVAVCDISEGGLEIIAKTFVDKGYTLYTEVVDLGKGDDISRFAENVSNHYGRIDIWVNNAGVNRIKSFEELTLDDWNFILNINLTATFWGTHVAAKHMKEWDGGVIINTASYAGIMPYSKGVPYSATKAGILSLTKSTAGVLAPYNIRVNAVVPGAVETPIMKTRLQDSQYRKNVLSRIALQRVCSAEEVAKTYLYLASDAAGYITGAAFEITGGKYCIQDIMNPWEQA